MKALGDVHALQPGEVGDGLAERLDREASGVIHPRHISGVQTGGGDLLGDVVVDLLGGALLSHPLTVAGGRP